MYMLFRLHKPDVLAVGDLAVRRGVAQLHGRSDIPATRQGFALVEDLARPWRPYASVGCLYMWRSQDTVVAGANDKGEARARACKRQSDSNTDAQTQKRAKTATTPSKRAPRAQNKRAPSSTPTPSPSPKRRSPRRR